MSAITLEAIQAKQNELAKLIQQFSEQPGESGRTIEVEDRYIELEAGEHYAGAVLDADGNYRHDLVLMAQRPDKRLNWQSAMEWATSVGGTLPSRQEQALLFANCKPHLEGVYHWSSETHADDASHAWSCVFLIGNQGLNHKDDELSVVAVRRL